MTSPIAGADIYSDLAWMTHVANALDPLPSPYIYDPVAWIHDMIIWGDDGHPTEYQDEIMGAIPTKKRVAVRGPHGLGKTAMSAWMILWFADTRESQGWDWKMPTTASAWRQLDKFLWPEIHKWARKLDWDKIGRKPYSSRTELMQLQLKLNHGSAMALASDVPELIEGAHADHLFYLFDEAKAISGDIFDAAEGAFSAAGEDSKYEAYALAVSTPGETNGRFYEIHSRKPGFEDWWVRHVTLEEALKAGRVSQDWVDQRARQWGRTSAVFINRVLGNFASADEAGVIPLAFVEAAQDRWAAAHATDLVLPPFTNVGVDVARGGEDKTVMALRYGHIIEELRTTTLEDTAITAGRVEGLLEAKRPLGWAVIDVIGIGAGVLDQVRAQGYTTVPFSGAMKTPQVDISGELEFANLRSAAWWTLRELLDPRNGFEVQLPPDDELIGDLTSPKWRMNPGGKIQVESKDDIKKRLGRSPDVGDAVVMSFALIPEDAMEEYFTYEDRVQISPY